MRFIIGLTIGAGIGYILGTRDGRERYEEIVAGVSDFVGEEMVAQVTEFLDQGTAEIRRAANEGLDNVSSAGPETVDAAATETEEAGSDAVTED